MRRVILKKGKEHSLQQKHPWIFSGAIEKLPDCRPGEILPIYSAEGAFLAQGYFHPKNSLAGRILSFSKGDISTLLREKLKKAFRWRSFLGLEAYRLINSEGDGLPGLVIDCYRDVVVLQISTWGMENLRDFWVKELRALLSPRTIYEKSLSGARLQEGLKEKQGLLFGDPLEEVSFKENGLLYTFSLPLGQKTGFFLDQREMRATLRFFAKERTVLNCFSYIGGFSLEALKGGAKKVLSIDSSPHALRYLEKNLGSNNFSDRHESILADVFKYLPTLSDFPFDLVILDPPALVKKRSDLQAAMRAYQALHQTVFKKIVPEGLVMTSSCSSYLTPDFFEKVIRLAAAETGREVQILMRHHQALDHPVTLAHPEGNYLKSFLLKIN
jgi:23S rRNA (cytosine1962-C5)-methyltransferase